MAVHNNVSNSCFYDFLFDTGENTVEVYGTDFYAESDVMDGVRARSMLESLENFSDDNNLGEWTVSLLEQGDSFGAFTHCSDVSPVLGEEYRAPALVYFEGVVRDPEAEDLLG